MIERIDCASTPLSLFFSSQSSSLPICICIFSSSFPKKNCCYFRWPQIFKMTKKKYFASFHLYSLERQSHDFFFFFFLFLFCLKRGSGEAIFMHVSPPGKTHFLPTRPRESSKRFPPLASNFLTLLCPSHSHIHAWLSIYPSFASTSSPYLYHFLKEIIINFKSDYLNSLSTFI